MSTLEFRSSTDIDRSADTVWAVVSDYRSDPRWRRGVATMDPQPPGQVMVGTTTREVLRLAGRTYRSEGLVEAVGPGRSFRWRTVSGATAWGSRRVDELPDGRCTVALELSVVPGPAERFMVPILRRMLAGNLRSDLARLARHLDDVVADSHA